MAKITTETLRLDIIVDGDKARKALLDQEAVVEANTRALRELEAQQKKLSDSGDTSSKTYSELTEKIKNQNRTLAVAADKLEELRQQLPITSMTMEELRKRSTALRTALSKAVPGTENYRLLSNEICLCSRLFAIFALEKHQSSLTKNTILGQD